MKILEKKTKFFLNTLKMKMKIYIILFPPKLSECNQSQCHAKHRLGAISKKKKHWFSGGPTGPVGVLMVQWGSYWSSGGPTGPVSIMTLTGPCFFANFLFIFALRRPFNSHLLSV